MRVQFAHDVAHDALRLHVPLVRGQAHLFHLEQDAALDRFQPVFRIGQGARVND